MQDAWGGESDEQGIRVSWIQFPDTGLYEWHTEVNHQFNAEFIYHHPKSNLTFAVFLASSLFWFKKKKKVRRWIYGYEARRAVYGQKKKPILRSA